MHSDKAHPPTLSIVVPAYKKNYLSLTLESLRAQDCDRFEVIVVDDASPFDLLPIFDAHHQGLNARYWRFDHNLGQISLAEHWNRAIRLAKGEWILLLGDDDLLDRGVVSAFLQALKDTQRKYDVYRFNTRQINADGQVVKNNPCHPRWENGLDFLIARLGGARASYTCEYIFSREAFNRSGGFMSLPLGWCSDDAAWIAFSSRTGIYTITGPMSSWRASGINITTSSNPELGIKKLRANVMYLNWLKHFFISKSLPLYAPPLLQREIVEKGTLWFYRHLYKSSTALQLNDILDFSRELARFSGRLNIIHMFKLLKYDLIYALQAYKGSKKQK